MSNSLLSYVLQYGTELLFTMLFGSLSNWTVEYICSSELLVSNKQAQGDSIQEEEEEVEEEGRDYVPEIQVRLLDPKRKKLIHYPFRLKPQTKVSSIKDNVRQHLCDSQRGDVCETSTLPPSLAVIFMGQELADDYDLGSCDFGNNSILDVLNVPLDEKNILLNDSSISVHSLVDSLKEKLAAVDPQSPTTEQHLNPDSSATSDVRCSYFVYCEICDSLQHGKLRVCCNRCGLGSIIFQNEPENWDDLLKPDRIECHCYTPDCDGTRARFYFKCAQNHCDPTPTEESVQPLNRVRVNNIYATCIACYSTLEQEVLVFPNCSHVVCVDCFRSYIESSLWDRVFKLFPDDPVLDYTLDCPLHCVDSWIEAAHIRIIDQRFFAFYTRFRTEEIAFQNGGAVCVHENCNSIFYPPATGIPAECEVEQCPDCSSLHCLCCVFANAPFAESCKFYEQIEAHNLKILCLAHSAPESTLGYLKGLIRRVFPDLGLESATTPSWQESLSKATISQITKPCPKCRTPIERNGGCMHMLCTQRRCGFEWCWLCESEWSTDCQRSHWFF